MIEIRFVVVSKRFKCVFAKLSVTHQLCVTVLYSSVLL
jgi:hypothetical protein